MLKPLFLVGAVVGAVGSEMIHPHAYGLHIFPSNILTMKNGKRFHMHHWTLALVGMGLYSLRPFKRTWLDLLTKGILVGVFAQGVSYTASHMMFYDPTEYKVLRASAGD